VTGGLLGWEEEKSGFDLALGWFFFKQERPPSEDLISIAFDLPFASDPYQWGTMCEHFGLGHFILQKNPSRHFLYFN
jgi:hypothetical protein